MLSGEVAVGGDVLHTRSLELSRQAGARGNCGIGLAMDISQPARADRKDCWTTLVCGPTELSAAPHGCAPESLSVPPGNVLDVWRLKPRGGKGLGRLVLRTRRRITIDTSFSGRPSDDAVTVLEWGRLPKSSLSTSDEAVSEKDSCFLTEV